MAKQTINNGETGLVVRTKLNEMFTEIYDNEVNIQFSADGETSWHNTYAASDGYWRISRDMGNTWSDAIPIGTEAAESTTEQDVFTIVLPSAATIAGRIAGATSGTDYPTGWTLAAGSDPADLDITHSLARRVASVSVFYTVSGTENRQLVSFNNAYTGILTPSANALRIEGLTTIQKEIQIYITFAQ